jgi:hypothetical protein
MIAPSQRPMLDEQSGVGGAEGGDEAEEHGERDAETCAGAGSRTPCCHKELCIARVFSPVMGQTWSRK